MLHKIIKRHLKEQNNRRNLELRLVFVSANLFNSHAKFNLVSNNGLLFCKLEKNNFYEHFYFKIDYLIIKTHVTSKF